MAFTVTGVRWSFVVLTLLLVPQVAQALVSEAEVLKRFKSGVIDIQARLYDWGSSSDPCNITQDSTTWFGVSCEDLGGNLTVTEINLSFLSLRGTISEDLAGLENLRELDLSDNSLDGQIPESLLKLNLTFLDLSNNQLTGPIPKLPHSLRYLYLASNSLQGDIPVDNLLNLQLWYLILSGNKLTGRLPDKLEDHPSVKANLFYLDLSYNEIGGSLPSDLGGVGITYIDLSHNKFVGSIPEVPWGLTYYLDLSGNQLEGPIPSQLFNASADPIYLNLSGNSLSGFLSLQETTLTRIQFIDLSSNELENLVDLDFESGDGMAETLESLLLHNNRFSGSLDWIFRSNFSLLRELRVDGNQFLGGDMELASNSTGVRFPFPHLQVMNLSGSGLTGEIPSDVFRTETLPSLKILDLSKNRLKGSIPVTLTQMKSLLELYLKNNSLEGGIYRSRQQDDEWTNLEVLDLSHNMIQLDGTELGFGSHLASSNLRELRLGGCNPDNKTALPRMVGNLSLLEVLDLSSCNLVGNISGRYSRGDLFPSLKTLDLSDNLLEGSVPKEFGQLPSLTVLDVSNNDLSGTIPVLPSHLLNSSFFAGNPNLCGSPLLECTSKSSGLRTSEVAIIVVAAVVLAGGGCLFLGWIWRRKIDGKKHEQDAELIAALLDAEGSTSLMALRELQRSTSNFSEEYQIGEGGFGTVYRGILEDGTEVAIKKSKQDGSSSEEKRMFLNEVKILSKVNHQRLVPLLGCCLANKNALLVFAFVENGTLREHLNGSRGASALSWKNRLLIAVHTAEALDYLHSSAPPVYHLDVKSANILLDKDLNAQVTDFGISRLAPNLDSTHITALGIEGTPGYMDPEAVLDPFLTDKRDVYAFGVVLLELITAKPAVDASRPEDASIVKWAVPLIESDNLGKIIDQGRLMASAVMGVRWRSLVLLLQLLLLIPLVARAQALVSESDVLLRFKSGVIDRQANLVNWDISSSRDPCSVPATRDSNGTWYGVTCSPVAADGSLAVTDLTLSSFSLRGTISSVLAELAFLTSLDLSDNFFEGPIPETLSTLNLFYLDLSKNQLTGPIPKLPQSLVYLLLDSNSLDGDIHVDDLFNMTLAVLDLHGNKLTGKLADQLHNYPGVEQFLTYVDLSRNQIEGSLPSDLGEVGITYIDLSQNRFVGRIPEESWGSLYYLDLSGNQLDGSIPSLLFTNSADPIYLNLSRNSFSGLVSFQDSTLTRIQFIDLSFNQLENQNDLAIGNGIAETLQFLLLQNNKFSGNLDWILRGNFSALRELRLDGNQFRGTDLGLASNSTGARFPFPHLQVMNLSDSGLAGEIPSELFRSGIFPSLRILDLSNNKFDGSVPDTVTHMPRLLELRLQNNSLEGGIYKQQAQDWTNLQVLDLRHNLFLLDGTEIRLGEPAAPSNLRELRLGGSNPNNKGVLPTIVGNLSVLELLDLSNCNLDGNITQLYSSKDRLPSLKTLDLSNNFLKGSLPEGFGLMPSLIELDVSNNNLSGKLPMLPFPLLNYSFFTGNEELCGSPLPECHSKSRGLKMWEVAIIVVVAVLVSGGGCLFLGWIWRRKIYDKKHEQDAELIAALLDTESTTTLISLRELQRSTDNFSEAKQIGVGGFGWVYRGILYDGTEVAIKKSKQDGSSSEQRRMFLNEVKILSKVDHQHLVRLLGCCLANKNALLVFEFVENGTLLEHLNESRGATALSWNKRLQIAVQTAEALHYLHSSAPPIYHLDVKSSNILLDKNLNAKVADFGISKLAPNLDSTHITALGLEGTPGYMDPEAVVDPFLTNKRDVYAFGVVLLELITAKPAVDGTRPEDASLVKWAVPWIDKDQLVEIVDPNIFVTFGTPNGRESIMAVARFAARCLRFQSVQRPSMKEACADLLFIQQQFEFGECNKIQI